MDNTTHPIPIIKQMWLLALKMTHLLKLNTAIICKCADPDSFVRGGPFFTAFFQLIRGERIGIPL